MLNARQQAAVNYLDGPLLVLAGAGSGKTRVITEKIVHLINSGHTPAGRIAAITFTNKAAREMRKRVTARLDKSDIKELTICTFHALGLRFLRQEHAKLGFRAGFTIFDAQDSLNLVRDLLPANTPREQLQRVRNQISLWKNAALSATQIEPQQSDPALEIYAAYEEKLKRFNAFDFDDLILRPLELMRQQTTVRVTWQQRLRYLLVDEYQDTNGAQYELVKLFTGMNGALTVVGDDDQSIYGWRGAQAENLSLLMSDHANLQIIKLEQNYRSSGKILKAANALIAHNAHSVEKRLWSELGPGEDLRILVSKDADAEARKVVSQMLHRQFAGSHKLSEFAVLYRSNQQARAIELALRESQIPYHLSGGLSFFDRVEVKDLLSYARLLINRRDSAAFLRVVNTPRREIGANTVAQLAEVADSHAVGLFEAARHPMTSARLQPAAARRLQRFCEWIEQAAERLDRDTPQATLNMMIEEMDYFGWLRRQDRDKAQSRIASIKELIGWIADRSAAGSGDLEEVLAQLTLESSSDDEPGEVVRLMTLHAAKGLEFPVVFLVGVEEGLLPHSNSLDEGTLEEERRLMYVGVTRAQRSLYLSYVKSRRRYGEVVRNKPSRFLEELPQEVVVWDGNDQERDQENARALAKSHLSTLMQMVD